jgi:hypothetical protein
MRTRISSGQRGAGKISRRRFVAGSASIAAAAGLYANPVSTMAAAMRSDVGRGGAGIPMRRFKPVSLFAHHCSLVHQAMGEKLARTVSDPAICAEQTAIALRTTRCPCCNTMIAPVEGTSSSVTGVHTHA